MPNPPHTPLSTALPCPHFFCRLPHAAASHTRRTICCHMVPPSNKTWTAAQRSPVQHSRRMAPRNASGAPVHRHEASPAPEVLLGMWDQAVASWQRTTTTPAWGGGFVTKPRGGGGWAGGLMQEQALGCGLPSLPHHEAELPDCPVPRPSELSTATRPPPALRGMGGGSEANNKFVDLTSASDVGPLSQVSLFFLMWGGWVGASAGVGQGPK